MSEHNSQEESPSNKNGQKHRVRSSVDFKALTSQKPTTNVIEYIGVDEGIASAGASPKVAKNSDRCQTMQSQTIAHDTLRSEKNIVQDGFEPIVPD